MIYTVIACHVPEGEPIVEHFEAQDSHSAAVLFAHARKNECGDDLENIDIVAVIEGEHSDALGLIQVSNCADLIEEAE